MKDNFAAGGKRILRLALLLSITGCTSVGNVIEVAVVDTPSTISVAKKSPLKVGINIAEEDYSPIVTTGSGGGGPPISVPFGNILKNRSFDVFSKVFDEAKFTKISSPVPDVDLIITPSIAGSSFDEVDTTGWNFFTSTRVDASIKINIRVTNPEGKLVWEKAVQSPKIIGKSIDIIDRDKYRGAAIGGTVSEAVIAALSSASKEMLFSAEIANFKPANARRDPVASVAAQSASPSASVSPAAVSAATAASDVETFPTRPVAVNFTRAKSNPDDIAVIIGNANYKATARDIPDVVPAYADAEGMKNYAAQGLGIKEENIIFIKDARLIDLISTFGTTDDPKGKLFNWVKPGLSNVFVFYSGHGAPSADGASSYLVPVDAQAALINLSGYSLKTLYANLGKLPAKSVTVVLEACFSGASQSGMLVKNASPIYQKAMQEIIPLNLTVISAGSGNQIASWEQDKSHGLFTKHYLLGMAGAADHKPYGNGDGKVMVEELAAYLKGTMSYMAQRYYGREQTAQIVSSGK